MSQIRFFTWVFALAALLAGCTHAPDTHADRSGTSSPADARFEAATGDFLNGHFAYRPLEAVALGWHQYDGLFAVPTAAAVHAETARLERFDQTFAALSSNQLSRITRHDLALLRSAIAAQRWGLEIQKSATRNPMVYAGALDLSVYLKRDFKPLPARVRDMTAILRSAPALFAAARANLEPVLPKPFVETGIEVGEGTAAFIEKDVSKAAMSINDAVAKAEYEASSRAAVAEIRGFVTWLREEKLPKADASFALGSEAFRAMLRSELIDLSPDRILEIGLRELAVEQQRFAAAAAVIDPSRKAIDVYKAIQHEHPTAANLIPDTRSHLEAIRQFVLQHQIATIPSPVRPLVEETLPPFRSTSFASMDTPGPFETKATEAYYYVTPVEPDWTPQQAEEWLTAFNYYTTDIVSVHEVYPGHYVQFLALNASPATDREKIFYSYPFVEGWAHYTEQMMVEQGFGQPTASTSSKDELVKAAKYRLAQSDEALLRLCRLCCSIKLHTQSMSVDQATRFFVENCYYEEKPARQEALRGTFDPGYLYYTLGKLMILKLRRDCERQDGPQFSLQRFHDEFLRHGAAPLRLMREVMLKDPATWPDLL